MNTMQTEAVTKPQTRLSTDAIREWHEQAEQYLRDPIITGAARGFIEKGIKIAAEVRARREANGDWDRQPNQERTKPKWKSKK